MNREALTLEIGALVEAQLDGRATPEEQKRLEQLVCTDEEARAIYLQYMGDSALLGALGPLDPDANLADANLAGTGPPASLPALEGPLGGGSATPGGAPAAPLPPAPGVSDAPRGLFSLLWPNERWLDALPVVMFAGVMVALGVFFGGRLFGPAPEPPVGEQHIVKQPPAPAPLEPIVPPPAAPGQVQVATLVEESHCEWIESPPDFRPGSLVFEGQRLQLASGTALVVLRSGTRLVMEGPATLAMSQPNRLQLTAGSVGVRVPPEAVGFSIDTPIATVVDLGTEFSVSVDPQSLVEVHVFVGQVAVSGRAASGSVRSERLSAGDALRLPSGDRMTWSHIAMAPQRQFDATLARGLHRVESPEMRAEAAHGLASTAGWRPIFEATFGASGNETQWRKWLKRFPSRTTNTDPLAAQLRPTPQGLELVNAAGIMSAEPIATSPGSVCRVRAELLVRQASETVYLALRAKPPSEETTSLALEHGALPRVQAVACMFGGYTPDKNRTMAIVMDHPAAQVPRIVHAPCPAPEAGRRYVLQAIDDGQVVRFVVEATGTDAWQKEVQLEIPAELSAEAGLVGVGNLGPIDGEVVETVLEKFSVELNNNQTNSGARQPAPAKSP
jgi:hypothetical protein